MVLPTDRTMPDTSLHSSTRLDILIFTLVIGLLLICPTQAKAKDPCHELSADRQPAWCKPGCHKVGFRQLVEIPGCVKFWSETNACRGFCPSESYPSPLEILIIAPKQRITTAGRCCVMKPKMIKYNVWCRGGERTVMIKSADECYCGSCQKY